MACVVSKKVAPLSVARNRIRRQVRAVLAKEVTGYRPVTLVFTARIAARGATMRDVEADIRSLVGRAGVTYNTKI